MMDLNGNNVHAKKNPYLDSETLKNVCCGTAISTICYGTFLNFETP